MSIPRGQCACGATILIPLAADRETLGFSIRAHNDSERHMAWARARIDPSFEVATGYVGGKLDGLPLSHAVDGNAGQRTGAHSTRPTRTLE